MDAQAWWNYLADCTARAEQENAKRSPVESNNVGRLAQQFVNNLSPAAQQEYSNSIVIVPDDA
jgi:hypothetical protein